MMNIAFDNDGSRVVSVNVAVQQRPTIQSYTILQAITLRDTLNAAISAAHDAAEAEAEANREKFSLELGVDFEGQRTCALEAGPFETSEDAVAFAFAAKGRKAGSVMHDDEIVEWYDLTPALVSDDPIVGATLNIHTDAQGTLRDVILY